MLDNNKDAPQSSEHRERISLCISIRLDPKDIKRTQQLLSYSSSEVNYESGYEFALIISESSYETVYVTADILDQLLAIAQQYIPESIEVDHVAENNSIINVNAVVQKNKALQLKNDTRRFIISAWTQLP